MILAFSFFHLLSIFLFNQPFETQVTDTAPYLLAVKSDSIIYSKEDRIALKRLTLVASIDDKMPGDSLRYDQIELGQKVWAYAEFENLENEQQVIFLWLKDGESYLSFAVEVGISELWRTYSYITAREGNWKLQLTLEGYKTPIKELEFTVLGEKN
jgi:hypothetical protein